MELFFDYAKLERIITALPAQKPISESKTDGFKHLYENVFLPLNHGDNDTKLTVDVSRFDYDDLASFYDYIAEMCDNCASNPVVVLETIFDKLEPICRRMNYI